MNEKRKKLINAIVSTKEYKSLELASKDTDQFVVEEGFKRYVFSKALFELESKMYAVMRNVYYMDVVPHQHDFFEIQYVYSGCVKQNINGKIVELPKGTMTIFNKQVRHNIKVASSKDRFYHLGINEAVFTREFWDLVMDDNPIKNYIQGSLEGDIENKDYLMVECSQPIFEQLFEAIEEEYISRGPGFEKNIGAYLALVFNKYYQVSRDDGKDNKGSLKQKRIREIRRILDEAHKDITLTALAEQLHVHPNYLSKFVLKEMDANFNVLLKNVRLKKACHMLVATDISIEGISEEIGYRNVNYFYKVFKETYKMTPTSYRKENRQ